MRSLLPTLETWRSAGKTIAVARVVSTWGSAPRPPGSMLLVSEDGALAGSVSGGCIEGAVREVALNVLGGEPARIVEFGVDDQTAWSVGLSCGGTVRVLVQQFPVSLADQLIEAVRQGYPVVWITRLSDRREDGEIGGENGGEENELVGPDSVPGSDDDVVNLVEGTDGDTFIQRFDAPPRVVIIGGADIAVHLVQMADQLGFDTILIDPRAVFSDPDRFPVRPTRLETKWPQEVLPEIRLDSRSFAVMLTHDPKIDDPAIELLLASEIPYIGALGGRKTQKARRRRLQEAGHSVDQIDRIRGPVGLDIGSVTPAEIALSIMAEIVDVYRS